MENRGIFLNKKVRPYLFKYALTFLRRKILPLFHLGPHPLLKKSGYNFFRMAAISIAASAASVPLLLELLEDMIDPLQYERLDLVS